MAKALLDEYVLSQRRLLDDTERVYSRLVDETLALVQERDALRCEKAVIEYVCERLQQKEPPGAVWCLCDGRGTYTKRRRINDTMVQEVTAACPSNWHGDHVKGPARAPAQAASAAPVPDDVLDDIVEQATAPVKELECKVQ